MTQWPTALLSECCEIVSGSTPSTTQPSYWRGPIPWATPKDLSALSGAYICQTGRTISEAGLASCAATVLPVGSVLLSSRAPIGHVAINALPMATNQGFKNLIPKSDWVDAEFLYQWLRYKRAFLQGLGNGATFKEISSAVVSRIRIPVPPLSEQKRLAAILNCADALRAKRRLALAQLTMLTRAMFVDTFGDPATNPKKWSIRAIGDLLESATYGTSEKSASSGEFPVLRMNNITRSGEIDLSALKFMDLAESKRDRYLVRPGDVLFNRTNSPDLVGKSAVFRGPGVVAYAGYLIRLRCSAETDPEFLTAFLNSAYAKRMLRSMCKTIIGMANINATEIQAMRVPHPALELQRIFAERVRAIESLKDRQRKGLAELDALFASLQHRAFNGTL